MCLCPTRTHVRLLAAPAAPAAGAAPANKAAATGDKGRASPLPDAPRTVAVSGLDTPCHRAGIRAYRASLKQVRVLGCEHGGGVCMGARVLCNCTGICMHCKKPEAGERAGAQVGAAVGACIHQWGWYGALPLREPEGGVCERGAQSAGVWVWV